MAFRVKKGDMVVAISGEHAGRAPGKVLRVDPEKGTAIVEGYNVVKRHSKPTQKNPQGGIVEKEAMIHLSNLMLVDPKSGEPTRVGTKVLEDGKRVRYSKKSKELID
jgi:large subunit ribosomal protein L24